MLYIPMVAMGLLALGTYWLVRSTPDAGNSANTVKESNEPDYFMRAFAVRTFDAAGNIRSEVMGEMARHYPDTKWLEIDNIKIRSFDPQGRVTTASAKQGLTNQDSSEVKLLGDAVVIREAEKGKNFRPNQRLEYRGEFLHAYLKTEKIKSHKPVELLRGKDRFTADNLEFDNGEQTLQLRGRVKGILVPETK